MIDVTLHNFETEVIAASMDQPVLVDFWALVRALQGDRTAAGKAGGRLRGRQAGQDRFRPEQQLAAAFGVRSIPTVVLLMNGRPVDGFMGALPEGKIREFLDKHLLPPRDMQGEPQDDMTPAPPEAPLTQEDATRSSRRLREAEPANDDFRFAYVKALLLAGRTDEAKVAFAPVIGKTQRRFDSLQRLLDAMDFAEVPDAARRRRCGREDRGEPARLPGALRQGAPADGAAAVDRRDG